MIEIEQVVNRYLQEKDTDYAIMITGEWGCGKTYYVKHSLTNHINSILYPVKEDKETNYSAVYVSLYGLSKVDELPYVVAKSIHPIIDGKIAAIFKGLIGGFSDFWSVGTDNAKELSKFFEIKKTKVLIFDDIERVNDKKVEIKELLGAINQYAEHNHLKVILICNDEKTDDDFKEFQEKTIRYNVRFQRPLSDSFDDIISKKVSDDYVKYIVEQKELIINTFNAGKCKNLRTLLFVIDAFRDIFNKVLVDKYQLEILRSLLVSFMIYSIEYKRGKSFEELDELSNLRLYIGFLEPNNDKEPEYIDELYEKYGHIRHDYNHYPIINKYISDGFLNANELSVLINGLKEECINNEGTPAGKLLRLFEDWRMIDDDQFFNCITELLQYVKDVKYTIRALTTLYHQLLVIEHLGIENFKLDDSIEQIFKDSAKAREQQDGFNLYIENDIYQLSNSRYGEQVNKRYDAYISYIGEINRGLRAVGEQNIIDGFMASLKEGDSDRITEYCNSANFQFLLENLDVNKVFEILKLSNKAVVRALLSGFYNRFPDKVSGIAISPKEMAFMNNLRNLLNDYLNNLKVKRVSFIWYHLLMNKLDAIIGQNNV